MIKVLHVLSSLGGGGVENMLYNYYLRIDRKLINFDFIVHGDNASFLENEFKKMGCNIFHVTPKRSNLIKNLFETNSVIKNGNYDIVHCHQGPQGLFSLIFAKMAEVKVRVSHNHIAFVPESKKQAIFRKVLCWFNNKFATNYFACGKDAAIWAFGEKAYESGKVHIINNAIELDKFKYDKGRRAKIRGKLDADNKKVIGTVGRFAHQKNHRLLIEIFFKVSQIIPNSVLWLVGDGPLLSEIKDYVRELGLIDKVVYLGVRNDVEVLMQGMDLFLLPSRYEGLGIVYIESQAAGLKTIASKHVVPDETRVTDLISYVGLDEPIESWVQTIFRDLNDYERTNKNEEIAKCGFDIEIEAKKMEEKYLALASI